MKYLSLTSVKDIYLVLSQNTSTPDTQGATQKISAMRHLFAFYRFCVKHKVTECDLKIKANRDEFVDYVSEIVKLDGDNYTANFYSSITELEDCRVGSNFYSAGVVSKSKFNRTVILPYPTKYSLLNVQNEVLIQKKHVDGDEINEYLTSEKERLAFAFWLVRKNVIDDVNVIEDVHNKIAEKYSNELADSIIPNNDASKKCFTNDFQLKFTDNYEELSKEVILSTIAELEKTNQKKVEMPYQLIYYGAPGTGKSHEIEQLTNGSVVFRTTFHPDSDYSTFVGAYKPIMREVPMTTVIGTKVVPVEDKEGNPLYESKIQYEFVPQAFAQAYVEAWKDLDSPVFLVIEEINRGNCAQIFGDIFQLLDRRKSGFSNYYIVPDEDLHQYVAKAFKDGIDDRAFDIIKTGQNLCLPPNLYIWATMNTSDQSLFPIDSAFKRRWDWQYIPIEDAELNWKINVNGNKYDWWKFLQAINKEVFDLTLSEDKQLGYFFVQAKDNVIDAKVLVNKVFFYLWNDVFKDFDLDNSKVFRYADGPKSICFKDFYVSAGEIKEEIAEQILINLGLEKEA